MRIKAKDLILINDLHQLTNRAALRFQSISDRAFSILAILGGCIGLVFLLYSEILKLRYMLILYVLIIILSYLFFNKVKTDSFPLYLTLRNIAELLRLRFFARLSNIDNEKELNFSKLIEEFRFSSFSTSIAIVDLIKCSEPLPSKKQNISIYGLRKVKERWLNDQKNYFSNKGKN